MNAAARHSDLTTPTRARERMRHDDATVYQVLDEALVCHVATVVDGAPRVLPMLHARVGDTLYLHASTGSRLAATARAGGPAGVDVCVAATMLDALVLARAQFHHSVNYRSVVAHGAARLVTDTAERAVALAAIVDRVATGRSTTSRPPDQRELAATAVLAVPLDQAAAKVRAHGVADDPADLDLPYWAGVVPLHTSPGRPEPDAGVLVPVPAPLRRVRSPWHEPAPLTGHRVALEPLDLAHAAELCHALADPEVWRHLPHRAPTTPGDMAAVLADALDLAHAGRRVPWLLRETGTGRAVGTASYWDPDPAQRAVRLGSVWLGRPSWGTPTAAEALRLLLARAFDDLGAVRVECWTDAADRRSRSAVEGLGARREGVLRRHRRRADGSWRDTVTYALLDDEWPAVRTRLARIAG